MKLVTAIINHVAKLTHVVRIRTGEIDSQAIELAMGWDGARMLRTALLSTLTLVTCGLAAQAAHADVYKYTDEKGNIQYTDKPRTLPAQRLDVKTQKTDVVAVQERQEAEMKRMQDTAGARQQGAAAQADQRQGAEVSAKDKAERCVKARERYDSYMNSQRLFEELPNKERRYLSDSELEAARASAKASMDTFCK